MYVDRGSPEDAREMAKLYCQAFPESVEFFFGRKSAKLLLDLMELTFRLIFHWGGEALLLKDEGGQAVGYCLYLSAEQARLQRRWGKALTCLARLAAKVAPSELLRLLHNQLTMARSAESTRKIPKTKAEILSIAISPACQGQGLGTLLLEKVLQRIKNQPVILNVRANNESGKRLYAAAGFSAYGTTKDLLGEWIMLIREPRSHSQR
ncbi:MAG: N-acetyltransferase [Bacillota bacterium]|jgi:ribosomal protein S18 acetylase RimI-like enzyme|nr:N-acetyltransferase [Bacillota bacterium]